jgi:hypothetical protein
MIEGDATGQASAQEGSPQHELIGFQGWIGRIQAGIALDLEAAYDINNGYQADLAYPRHMHVALGIEFPLVVRGTFRKGFGLR